MMKHEEVKRKLKSLQNELRNLEVELRLSEKRLITEVNQIFKSLDLPLVTMIDDQVIKQLNQVQKDLMEGMDSHETKDRPNQLNKKLIDLENKREALEKELVVKKAMIENQKREFNEKLKTLINGLGIKTSITCDETDRLKKMRQFMETQLTKLQNEAQTKTEKGE